MSNTNTNSSINGIGIGALLARAADSLGDDSMLSVTTTLIEKATVSDLRNWRNSSSKQSIASTVKVAPLGAKANTASEMLGGMSFARATGVRDTNNYKAGDLMNDIASVKIYAMMVAQSARQKKDSLVSKFRKSKHSSAQKRKAINQPQARQQGIGIKKNLLEVESGGSPLRMDHTGVKGIDELIKDSNTINGPAQEVLAGQRLGQEKMADRSTLPSEGGGVMPDPLSDSSGMKLSSLGRTNVDPNKLKDSKKKDDKGDDEKEDENKDDKDKSLSSQLRELKKTGNPVKAAKQTANIITTVGSGQGLRWSWINLIPSWGLSFFLIDLFAFLHLIFPEKFCEIGKEWKPPVHPFGNKFGEKLVFYFINFILLILIIFVVGLFIDSDKVEKIQEIGETATQQAPASSN